MENQQIINPLVLSNEIKQKLITVRGQLSLLDRDVAALYGFAPERRTRVEFVTIFVTFRDFVNVVEFFRVRVFREERTAVFQQDRVERVKRLGVEQAAERVQREKQIAFMEKNGYKRIELKESSGWAAAAFTNLN